MRLHEKHHHALTQSQLAGIDLHRFMELDGHASFMETAQELGMSIGDVKKLKKKLNRA